MIKAFWSNLACHLTADLILSHSGHHEKEGEVLKFVFKWATCSVLFHST